MELIDKKYVKCLRGVYFSEKLENAQSAYYKSYVTHKYKHSIDVLRMGLEIMNSDKLLKNLPLQVKKDFALALLLHDIARSKEIDPSTGEPNHIDHAVEGARDVFSLGTTSLNVIIPIMVHSKINEDYVLANDKALLKRADFRSLSEADKTFVLCARNAFNLLSEEEKRTVMLGVELVKDADKMSNLQHFNKMIELSPAKVSPKLTSLIVKQFFAGGLTNRDKLKTTADDCFAYLSWVNDLRFEASKTLVKKLGILGGIKRYMLGSFEGCDKNEVAEFKVFLERAMAGLQTPHPYPLDI